MSEGAENGWLGPSTYRACHARRAINALGLETIGRIRRKRPCWTFPRRPCATGTEMSWRTKFALILCIGSLRVLIIASRALGGCARARWTEMPLWANDCAMTSGATWAVVSSTAFRTSALRVRTRLVVVRAGRTRMLHTVLRLARAPMARRAQVCLVVHSFLQAIMASWTRFTAGRAHPPGEVVVGPSWAWDKPRSRRTEAPGRTKIFGRIRRSCWKCAVVTRIALRT